MHFHGKPAAMVASLAMIGVLLAGCSSSSPNSSSASTSGNSLNKSPITLGVVADLTGGDTAYIDSVAGAMARIDLQNAKGGINGHPLKLVSADSATSETTTTTATTELVENKGAIGIVEMNVFPNGAAKFLESRDVPFDGQAIIPDFVTTRNGFSYSGLATPTTFNGVTYSANSTWADFLKTVGVTKLACLAFAQVGSVDTCKTLLGAGAKFGITPCYTNYSIPFTPTDFTSIALQIKASGCNGLSDGLTASQSASLAQAEKNAGINIPELFPLGYEQNTLSSPVAVSALDGAYFDTAINFSAPSNAVQGMLSALSKYDPSYKGGVPDLGTYGAYLNTDLLIQGLLAAGDKFTPTGLTNAVRSLTSYDAGGILPYSVNYKHFGSPSALPKQTCSYFAQLSGHNFTTYKNKLFCEPLAVLTGI